MLFVHLIHLDIIFLSKFHFTFDSLYFKTTRSLELFQLFSQSWHSNCETRVFWVNLNYFLVEILRECNLLKHSKLYHKVESKFIFWLFFSQIVSYFHYSTVSKPSEFRKFRSIGITCLVPWCKICFREWKARCYFKGNKLL